MDDGRAPLVTPDRRRLLDTLAAIDEVHREDPVVIAFRGNAQPRELVHAVLMTEWVRNLDPEADHVQRVAARAHHLRRWALPRSDYPEGRGGYLRWRRDQGRRHADLVAGVLAPFGWPEADIERVQGIVRKQGLGHDAAVQTHEDALCLVFLEQQFDDLAAELGDEHMVEVLVKTLAKMSARGREAAGTVRLSSHGADLVARAAAAAGPPAGGGS